MKKKKHASKSTPASAVETELDRIVLFVSRIASIPENPMNWPISQEEVYNFTRCTIKEAADLASASFFKQRALDAEKRLLARIQNQNQ